MSDYPVLATHVRVDPTPFVRSHGQMPRGRGTWAFCPEAQADSAEYLKFVFWAKYGLTYREAKAAAQVHFAAKGIADIVALP